VREEIVDAVKLQAPIARAANSIAAPTWRLDANGFDELLTQILRQDDDIPLRRFLFTSSKDAQELFKAESDEILCLSDRLVSAAALALQFDRHSWFKKAVDALVRVYETGFDERGYEIDTPFTVRFWLHVISRVHGLGSLAVRLEQWDAVRILADRRPRGEQFGHYGSWLRHGMTMAARRDMLKRDDENLVARARNSVRHIESLRPDVLADAPDILNSLCQFDVYGCLTVMGAKGIKSGNYYPNFSRYESRRSEPAFVKIVDDPEVRGALFREDSETLAACIDALLHRAFDEGIRFGAWSGVFDHRVSAFLDENRPVADPL
jgi:hypothetical protein